MKSNSDKRPAPFETVGDGSFWYNYDIKEVTVTNEEGEERTSYEYETVRVWSTPTRESVTKAVLRDFVDETEEFNLINRYNSFQLGISEDNADLDEYEAYLLRVKELKEMVRADVNEYDNRPGV